MTKKLEDKFHNAMEAIYHAATEHGYRATYFLRMVRENGGVAVAKRLLAAPEYQEGLTRLWEIGRLDISVEALVLQERWETLFSDDERREARERLKDFGYAP